ncbi:MAG: ABC transporter ATP-binding protein [Treponemataceae bacterium]
MLTSTILYLNVFSQKLEEILWTFLDLRYGKTSKDKLEKINLGKKDLTFLPVTDDFLINLKNVFFAYPETEMKKNKEENTDGKNAKEKIEGKTQKFALENISATIHKGDKILLRGKSGSGKSTLIKILLNILQPTKGGVYYNGKILQKNEFLPFYCVDQKFHIFSLSLAENIFFDKKPEKKAFDLSRLENLYERSSENVGLEGKKLSGGERERLALARLFGGEYKNIILDESFSALDFKNYEAIQNKFLENEEITYIEISHREIDTSKFDYIWELIEGDLHVKTLLEK